MSELSYPFVTIRFMSCVYGSRPIRWGGSPVRPDQSVVVPGAPPPDRNHLTPEERDAVLQATLREIRATGRRHCVHFGPDDTVYVEPDGRHNAGPPPSGGIRV